MSWVGLLEGRLEIWRDSDSEALAWLDLLVLLQDRRVQTQSSLGLHFLIEERIGGNTLGCLHHCGLNVCVRALMEQVVERGPLTLLEVGEIFAEVSQLELPPELTALLGDFGGLGRVSGGSGGSNLAFLGI